MSAPVRKRKRASSTKDKKKKTKKAKTQDKTEDKSQDETKTEDKSQDETKTGPVECLWCGWEECAAKGDESKCDRLTCPVPECKRKRFSHPKAAAWHLETEHDQLTLCFRCEMACGPDQKTCSTCNKAPEIDVFSVYYMRCQRCGFNAPMCMGGEDSKQGCTRQTS